MPACARVPCVPPVTTPHLPTHTRTHTHTPCTHLLAEFCAKGSLYNVLQRGRQSPEAAAQLGWQRRLGMALDAAVGLLYLHSLQPAIIHRDVKSPNLLVDKAWTVKVGGGAGAGRGVRLGGAGGTVSQAQCMLRGLLRCSIELLGLGRVAKHAQV